MRSHKTPDQWSQHVHAFKASGLTQAAYCRRHKVSACRLSHWVSRLGGKTARLRASRFVEVKVADEAPRQSAARATRGVRVVLAYGTAVEAIGDDIAAVAALVGLLRGRAP